MNDKAHYLRLLEDGMAAMRTHELGGCNSRLEYLGENIFDFTTYDSEMAELFATKALEVCAAISFNKTFEYIKDPESYRWFLLMCNMHFFRGRISWGTSIRGAFWSPAGSTRHFELDTCGLWSGDHQVTELKFEPHEWLEFIEALLEFGAMPDADRQER